MHEPVTIESGRTFERESIDKYFKVLEMRKENAVSDSEDEG